jgi:hypothetical protein
MCDSHENSEKHSFERMFSGAREGFHGLDVVFAGTGCDDNPIRLLF